MTEETVGTPEPPGGEIAELIRVRAEIRNTWKRASSVGSQIEAFRILERMVDRLGYGRTENNPPYDP